MTQFIPYGRQSIDQADIDAVVEVLKSEFLTQGPAVSAFEQAVAAKCGAAHCVASNSATSSLHLACKALGVGPGDLIWTSPITFVASSNAALYCGGEVDFVDIDPRTFNMCPEKFSAKLDEAASKGRVPKVVIPVHLAGQSCDMARIHAVASRHGVRIIEDASHAIGGNYEGKRVGDCRYSDITVFSFHPVKIVTTGEGGMALTNDLQLAETMLMDRSHGITRDADKLDAPDEGGWYYEQQRLGFNYRMTDIAAALGHSQLARLDEFVARRREIAVNYNSAFAEIGGVATPYQLPASDSAWHLYIIRVEATRHRAIFEALREAGIGVNLHYMPVYLQPYYRDFGFPKGHCPEAEKYYAEAISIPMFSALSDKEQAAVIEEVARATR